MRGCAEAERLFRLPAGELQGHQCRAVGLKERGDVPGPDANAADAVVDAGAVPVLDANDRVLKSRACGLCP